jgi:hypothetical protein
VKIVQLGLEFGIIERCAWKKSNASSFEELQLCVFVVSSVAEGDVVVVDVVVFDLQATRVSCF